MIKKLIINKNKRLTHKNIIITNQNQVVLTIQKISLLIELHNKIIIYSKNKTNMIVKVCHIKKIKNKDRKV